MKYTIYKTINLVNGKFYIGKHQTINENDSYLGSGKLLLSAIKKYGVENFKKEVLFVYDREEDMNKKELEIITEQFVLDNNNYNIGVGGEGGPHFKGKSHSDKTRKKLSEKRKNQSPISDETREKIREGNRRRFISAETRNKISIKAKEREDKKRQLDSLIDT